MNPSCEDTSRFPVVAAIAAVIHDERVLLVRRAHPPDAGHWGFPGGKIEAGETIEGAAVRELFEETAIRASAQQVLTAVDAFDRSETGALRQHFVLVAVLCRWVAGAPTAGDDALDAKWFHPDDLDDAHLALSLDVARVARLALASSRERAKGEHRPWRHE